MRSSRHVAALAAIATAALAGCGEAEDTTPVADAKPAARAAETSAPAAPALTATELRALSDDFDGPDALDRWKRTDGDFAPAKVAVRDGKLHVTPPKSTWVDDKRAFHLFKRVTGDFTAVLRIDASGTASRRPKANWSLSGLLVRRPDGEPADEDWVALRYGSVGDMWVVERKTTEDSISDLRLEQVPAGGATLRIRRRGEDLTVAIRRGGTWDKLETYIRPDLPPALDVGIDALSGAEGGEPADLVSRVDAIEFSP